MPLVLCLRLIHVNIAYFVSVFDKCSILALETTRFPVCSMAVLVNEIPDFMLPDAYAFLFLYCAIK